MKLSERKRQFSLHTYESLLEAFAIHTYGDNWRNVVSVERVRREYAESRGKR